MKSNQNDLQKKRNCENTNLKRKNLFQKLFVRINLNMLQNFNFNKKIFVNN